LRGMQEIRNQLEFQFKILERLYNAEAIASFQKEILEIIGSIDPNARDEIIRRLHKTMLLRQSVRLD
jgi:hypothetical protein